MAENHAECVIRIQGLRKSFGAQQVLNGIDVNVKHGETMAILGRSGTGKSVLLKLIVGLHRPDAGSIAIKDQDIGSITPANLREIRKKIGFLFQSAALFDSLTVEENVAFPLRRHTDLGRDERKSRVEALLSLVGMREAGRKMPGELSGGMKKRVGLARALSLDPEIVLFDEPTAGLDPITAGEINDLIRDLQSERQLSSVVVTHDMQSTKQIANQITLLNEGRVVFQGTFGALEQSKDPFVQQFLERSR